MVVKKPSPRLQVLQITKQSRRHGSCKVSGVAPATIIAVASKDLRPMFFSLIEEVASLASVTLFIAAIALWSDVLARF
jgi:hypothetical protein